MSNFLWNIRCAYWLVVYKYVKWTQAYKYACDECWQEFRADGYSPREAVIEDLSNFQD